MKETKEAIKMEDMDWILLFGKNGVDKTTNLTAMIGNDAVNHYEHKYDHNGNRFMELSRLANSDAHLKVATSLTSALKQGGM